MAKVLITGITGQDGAFLARSLIERGDEVYGAMRRGSTSKTGRLKELGIREKVNLCTLEVTEFANVQNVLNDIRPDKIFNLAAQSFVADSFQFPHYTSEVNYMGVLNILEAIRILKLDTKLYQASTSEMYGDVLEKPQSEKTPFNPLSPYAVSKLGAHSLVVNYRQAYEMFATSGILFNHESELRGYEFVTRKITSWLARIKLHNGDAMPLGNLSSVRDWGYAPEYTDMMIKMLDHDQPDDFVISTNTEYTVRDFLFMAAQEVGFDLQSEGEGADEKCYDKKTGRLIAYVDPRYFRASDVVYLRGDNSKAQEVLGWTPKVLVPELARKMAIYDLKKAAVEMPGL
ncbi:GDP-mannose 4,6-dehydratase [Roseibium denhamense]|uniref:GDP-mannose 4,6-dehydratase n=1 Tax=Roseibium denhamense TaxID=76305 RepID=A0ABY1NUV6_9HYPH|nr:GDP-mannose 4,6-dehydratase [Roseibium denhamense]SMP18643.1 GDPmannose 4,6-dehydratase [Roseibium denhamense]